MDKQPSLIIIMGLPATGKTTLSRKIAENFNLPLISRDEIKVRIMDKVGWGDREWSKKVGQASYSLLDYIMQQLTELKASFIVESDYNPEYADRRFDQINQSGYQIIQIICSAKDDVIIDRWKKRAAQDTTHPSNAEGEQGFSDLLKMLSSGQRKPLNVPSEIIQVDTSDTVSFEYSNVIARLQDLL